MSDDIEYTAGEIEKFKYIFNLPKEKQKIELSYLKPKLQKKFNTWEKKQIEEQNKNQGEETPPKSQEPFKEDSDIADIFGEGYVSADKIQHELNSGINDIAEDSIKHLLNENKIQNDQLLKLENSEDLPEEEICEEGLAFFNTESGYKYTSLSKEDKKLFNELAKNTNFAEYGEMLINDPKDKRTKKYFAMEFLKLKSQFNEKKIEKIKENSNLQNQITKIRKEAFGQAKTSLKHVENLLKTFNKTKETLKIESENIEKYKDCLKNITDIDEKLNKIEEQLKNIEELIKLNTKLKNGKELDENEKKQLEDFKSEFKELNDKNLEAKTKEINGTKKELNEKKAEKEIERDSLESELLSDNNTKESLDRKRKELMAKIKTEEEESKNIRIGEKNQNKHKANLKKLEAELEKTNKILKGVNKFRSESQKINDEIDDNKLELEKIEKELKNENERMKELKNPSNSEFAKSIKKYWCNKRINALLKKQESKNEKKNELAEKSESSKGKEKEEEKDLQDKILAREKEIERLKNLSRWRHPSDLIKPPFSAGKTYRQAAIDKQEQELKALKILSNKNTSKTIEIKEKEVQEQTQQNNLKLEYAKAEQEHLQADTKVFSKGFTNSTKNNNATKHSKEITEKGNRTSQIINDRKREDTIKLIETYEKNLAEKSAELTADSNIKIEAKINDEIIEMPLIHNGRTGKPLFKKDEPVNAEAYLNCLVNEVKERCTGLNVSESELKKQEATMLLAMAAKFETIIRNHLDDEQKANSIISTFNQGIVNKLKNDRSLEPATIIEELGDGKNLQDVLQNIKQSKTLSQSQDGAQR